MNQTLTRVRPMTRMRRNTQRGAVLIVALLFLTILTILGVTAMTTTTFEERMAGHARDLGVAFQAADAALRDARRDINTIVIPPFASPRTPAIVGKTGFGDGSDTDNGSCTADGLCRPTAYDASTGIAPATLAVNMQAAPSIAYGTFTGAPLLTGVSAQPRYIIEVLCFPRFDDSLAGASHCNFYRITARGYGGNINTTVTLQEIFLKL
jgi:type IV pilus assembly protein PilX